MSVLSRVEMFNRRASSSKNKSDEIIRRLDIKKGSIIVDIGSGGGYYTIRFAGETGLGGKVYAVDINKDFLQYIDFQAEKSGFTNIRTVFVDKKVKGLPKGNCDLVFLRNVYHHIYEPEVYFKEIKRFLKPNARIAIIDYKKTNSFSFINLVRHYVKQEDIIATLKKAGFKHVRTYNFLPEQSFNIFEIN